ncbi:hypothetical protein LTR70_001812 [Exophiala xenobiotica]|uniref:Transmembrane protein n=1 Tax=Lithohypha guttulata TaxID=1690604 RepID=A0ABR0KLW3_9EURO|nr:hypothetical protein LTR24_000994 [Lithohypha guttulata]KAK5327070.1 hypothetical protein LTR70_001812 [Exophiala xenobiotica]
MSTPVTEATTPYTTPLLRGGNFAVAPTLPTPSASSIVRPITCFGSPRPTTRTSAATAGALEEDVPRKQMSTAIILAIVAPLVSLLVLACLVDWLRMRKRQQQQQQQQQQEDHIQDKLDDIDGE